ncbi:hypothetical protein L2E82_45689 [Cichorium intybus]|uniref:Uncharacterized protein n=1 Tax=Cichorium intybus TaxID=13427 RepID=A0ACB8ZTK8_CICIN|nr:hypothetical protein L2E82_45689 [Cichorium intybus]
MEKIAQYIRSWVPKQEYKTHGVPYKETQTPDVVQQDVPQPETQTPSQDVPQQETQTLDVVQQDIPQPETQNPDVVQQENQCVDEGDGIDVSDFDKPVNTIKDMRESKYSDVDIIQCLGITES